MYICARCREDIEGAAYADSVNNRWLCWSCLIRIDPHYAADLAKADVQLATIKRRERKQAQNLL